MPVLCWHLLVTREILSSDWFSPITEAFDQDFQKQIRITLSTTFTRNPTQSKQMVLITKTFYQDLQNNRITVPFIFTRDPTHSTNGVHFRRQNVLVSHLPQHNPSFNDLLLEFPKTTCTHASSNYSPPLLTLQNTFHEHPPELEENNGLALMF